MDDLKMMKNPDSWPNWPQLPVKRNRNGHTAECGIMYENSRNVILTNMFASVEERQAANQISYDTYDAALADGWVVD